MTNPRLGVVVCEGADAFTFLQGQLSCDMRALSSNQGAMACYLNLKGRIIALLYVIPRNSDYLLIMPYDMVSSFIQKLHKFIVFSKARLTDASLLWDIKGEIGSVGNQERYLIESTNNGFIFYLNPSAGLSLHLTENGTSHPLSTEFLYASIQGRLPWIGLPESEKFLPHYLNLIEWGAVSFDKGCFVGQEVVARMQYRGHLDKATCVFQLPGMVNLSPQAPLIIEEQVIGEVVNTIYYAGNTYILAIAANKNALSK